MCHYFVIILSTFCSVYLLSCTKVKFLIIFFFLLDYHFLLFFVLVDRSSQCFKNLNVIVI